MLPWSCGAGALIRKPASTQRLYGGLSTLRLSWLTHCVIAVPVAFHIQPTTQCLLDHVSVAGIRLASKTEGSGCC